MKKIHKTWNDIEGACIDIARQLMRDRWKPDYVVGLTRGGLVPATLLSQFLNVPMHTLHVSLRDHSENSLESNCWMSEDAYGYDTNKTYPSEEPRKKILIVDDINDTGATLEWIKQDWQGSCVPKDELWDKHIWHNNVRFAVLTDNQSSSSDVDYSVWEINKAEEDVWIVHPWEDFWK